MENKTNGKLYYAFLKLEAEMFKNNGKIRDISQYSKTEIDFAGKKYSVALTMFC